MLIWLALQRMHLPNRLTDKAFSGSIEVKRNIFNNTIWLKPLSHADFKPFNKAFILKKIILSESKTV